MPCNSTCSANRDLKLIQKPQSPKALNPNTNGAQSSPRLGSSYGKTFSGARFASQLHAPGPGRFGLGFIGFWIQGIVGSASLWYERNRSQSSDMQKRGSGLFRLRRGGERTSRTVESGQWSSVLLPESREDLERGTEHKLKFWLLVCVKGYFTGSIRKPSYGSPFLLGAEFRTAHDGVQYLQFKLRWCTWLRHCT